MAKSDITHEGVVKSVDGGKVVVQIVSSSACASCHAAALCTSADAVTKSIEAQADPSHPCSPGDRVSVFLTRELGLRAVVLAYVVPLALLMVVVVGLSFTSIHELAVAGLGLFAMALWYGVLYLARADIGRDYVFRIGPPPVENNSQTI